MTFGLRGNKNQTTELNSDLASYSLLIFACVGLFMANIRLFSIVLLKTFLQINDIKNSAEASCRSFEIDIHLKMYSSTNCMRNEFA